MQVSPPNRWVTSVNRVGTELPNCGGPELDCGRPRRLTRPQFKRIVGGQPWAVHAYFLAHPISSYLPLLTGFQHSSVWRSPLPRRLPIEERPAVFGIRKKETQMFGIPPLAIAIGILIVVMISAMYIADRRKNNASNDEAS